MMNVENPWLADADRHFDGPGMPECEYCAEDMTADEFTRNGGTVCDECLPDAIRDGLDADHFSEDTPSID